MARYFIVEVKEVWTNYVKVEADSPKEALAKVQDSTDRGEEEYSYTLGVEDWCMAEYDEKYEKQLDWYEAEQVGQGLKK